jgi:hypothetical protein
MPVEAPTLANFAANLLEHVMITAGTNRIRGGKVVGEIYQIHVGDEATGFSIIGDNPTEAFQKFFYWIVTKKIEHTREDLIAAAEQYLKKEEEESAVFLDRITEGGMSEFGKKVQEYRRNRGHLICQAIRDLKVTDSPPLRLEEWKTAITEATGLEDLDPQEILLGFADDEAIEKYQRPSQ